MEKIIFLTLLIISNVGCKRPENNLGPLDFAKQVAINSTYDKDSSTLLIDVTLQKNIHTYAEGELIGKPVRLEILPDGGFQPDGKPVMPKPQSKKLVDEHESKIIEGSFRISQKLKKGHGKGAALLHLQVCSKNACDRPRSHKISF